MRSAVVDFEMGQGCSTTGEKTGGMNNWPPKQLLLIMDTKLANATGHLPILIPQPVQFGKPGFLFNLAKCITVTLIQHATPERRIKKKRGGEFNPENFHDARIRPHARTHTHA